MYNFAPFLFVSFWPILVQPTEFPQVQFNKNNDVLTSKEYIMQYLFWD